MIKQECHCKIGRYCLLKYASIMYHVIYENVCSECYERFEDTKGVTGSPRLKKNKQCNFQRKKGQKNDIQENRQKSKNPGAPEGS